MTIFTLDLSARQFHRKLPPIKQFQQNPHTFTAGQAHIKDRFVPGEGTIQDQNSLAMVWAIDHLQRTGSAFTNSGIDLFHALLYPVDQNIRHFRRFSAKSQ